MHQVELTGARGSLRAPLQAGDRRPPILDLNRAAEFGALRLNRSGPSAASIDVVIVDPIIGDSEHDEHPGVDIAPHPPAAI